MSKAINDTDRYTVTTSAIQDLVGKVKAEDAKKVDIQNVSLESQTTTILAQVQDMAASNIHYKRFYTTSDGGSANISDKPSGTTNGGFVCEAYCNRRVSASDWRYVVICYVKTSTPNIAWVTQATTAISWSTIDTHWTSHLYAGSGTAANAATTNGNTKLTVADNSTVRNTVTIQGSNNVSVSSDANGVITIDGSHNHDAVYMKATAGTKNLASNTETTIGTVNGSDVKLKMPVIPGASSTTPIVDGTASKGSESSWARGDHVHPTDTSREAASNKKTTLNSTSDTDFPTSKAVATFVNSSIATATANFLGTYDVVADLGLTTSATNAQIATALGSHTWPTGVTPTNNDYVFVSVDDPGTTTASAEYRRFKYDGSAWSYEYTLNNSSFTQAQWDAINSGVTASFVTNAVTGVKGSSESSYRTGQVNITKSNIGLGSVVNTGDSATPVSGGTTKFTTGGAYTELGKKVSKSGDTMTGQLINSTGEALSILASHGTSSKDASVGARRTDTGVGVFMGVGGGGENHGVYSEKNSNWIIKSNNSGVVTINDGKASNKVAIGNSNLGSTTKPIYLASGVPTEGSSYAGGTAVTLNGTSAAASTASFYAPTSAGTNRRFLRSNGSGAPSWAIPACDYAFSGAAWSDSGNTKIMWAFRLKGITAQNYNNILLSFDTYFWNNQKSSSDLIYIGWSNNGTQGFVATAGRVRVCGRDNVSNSNYLKYYYVKNNADTAADCTLDIYIAPSQVGNSYGAFYVNVLNSSNRDLDDIIEKKETYNVALPDGAVEITYTGNIGAATKATQDSDGNAINATYLKLSGGTMTGKITAWGSKYTDDGTTGAIDMQNSNIVGLNSIYTKDASENASEGIHFYRDATHTDTLWMAGGHMYFVPNRTLAGSSASTSAADSRKVAILPASITSGHVVVTDGTSGDVKGVAASTLTVGAATKAAQDSDGNAINATYFKSSGNVTLVAGTATKIGTQNGTDVKLTLPSAYSLPLAANGTRGGIQIGYSESGTNYAVKLSSEKAYVTVPWTDTKQNITLATTTKAFITGVSTTPTSTAQALTGLADTGVYLTTTAGELNATQYKVNEHCTMKYNSTKSSLDFTFA